MNKEERKKELLEKYGEVGVCPSCHDFMIWGKMDHSFLFRDKKLTIKNYPTLICVNYSCQATGVNNAQLEYIKGRARRRFNLTNITVSDFDFLKKYMD